jgi:ribose 5-phosphate isomerase B
MIDSGIPTIPTIVLGADHAGYKLKEAIKNYLIEQKFPVEDVGTWTDESVDYPDYARKVSERVAGSDKVGVLVCGTAIGMTIAANKVDGIRAAQVHDLFTAKMAREHNDANVLTLGARVMEQEAGIAAVREFLDAKFLGGRHQRRIDKINEMDKVHASDGSDGASKKAAQEQ